MSFRAIEEDCFLNTRLVGEVGAHRRRRREEGSEIGVGSHTECEIRRYGYKFMRGKGKLGGMGLVRLGG